MRRQRKKLTLVVSDGGSIKAIYDDALVPLMDQAESVVTRRASHVEPSITEWGDGRSYWTADLSPVGGPMLTGFTTRKAALDAEVEYLRGHVIK